MEIATNNWTEEEWSAAMRYGEEHEFAASPTQPCDGTTCCILDTQMCHSNHNGFYCTLPAGHRGPHASCGSDEPNPLFHNLYVWEQGSPASDIAAHIFETANAINRAYRASLQ